MSNGQSPAMVFAKGAVVWQTTSKLRMTGRVFSLSPGERAGVRGKKPSANPCAHELVRMPRRREAHAQKRAPHPLPDYCRHHTVARGWQAGEQAELSLGDVLAWFDCVS